jgi:hypothetical protein
MTKEERKAYWKVYKEKNKEKLKLYREENKEYFQDYYQNNKEKMLTQSREYFESNHHYCLERNRKYSEKYRKENKEKIQSYKVNKYQNHLPTKITQILRSRFNNALKNNYKHSSVINLLGCNINELKIYLESKFLKGMNWENWGEIWEIDHIKPCNSFNLNNLDHQKECFNYLNLQPLFKTTDIAKSFGYLKEVGNRNKGGQK